MACSHPDFKKCGDVFIALWDPKFCALNKDGTWKSFTFACQACTNKYPDTEYLGVADGMCEEDLPPVDPPVKVCNKVCIQGYKCVNGECVPVDDQCIFMKCSNGFVCKDSKCIPVDPPVDKCVTVKCKSGEKCLDGKCVFIDPPPIDLCKIVLCPKNKICVKGACVDDPCSKCASYETCTPEKTCLDKCALIRCAEGYNC